MNSKEIPEVSYLSKKKRKVKTFPKDETLFKEMMETENENTSAGMGPVEGGEKEEEEEEEAGRAREMDWTFNPAGKKKNRNRKGRRKFTVEEELYCKTTEEDSQSEILYSREPRETSQEANHAEMEELLNYQQLLSRLMSQLRADRGELPVGGARSGFVLPAPQVVRIGGTRTGLVNFGEICRSLHRRPGHLLDYITNEYMTSASVNGSNWLILQGRFRPLHVEKVLKAYINEYVLCHACKSAETVIRRVDRLDYVQCDQCQAQTTVKRIVRTTYRSLRHSRRS